MNIYKLYIIFVGVMIFFSYNQTIVFCIDLDVMKYLGSLACNVSKDHKNLIDRVDESLRLHI